MLAEEGNKDGDVFEMQKKIEQELLDHQLIPEGGNAQEDRKQDEPTCHLCQLPLFMEGNEKEVYPLTGCSDLFHKDCIQSWIKSRVAQNGQLTITCPKPDCCQ